MCIVLFILQWNDVFFIWTINELCYTYIWGLSSHSRVFHSCGDVTIDCEGLRILTYTLHSTLIGEGSLVCHTYSDMGFVHSSLSRPRIESRSPECKANVLPTLYTCLSSLLNQILLLTVEQSENGTTTCTYVYKNLETKFSHAACLLFLTIMQPPRWLSGRVFALHSGVRDSIGSCNKPKS